MAESSQTQLMQSAWISGRCRLRRGNPRICVLGAVRCCAPDLQRLAKLETRGVIITAEADSDEADFISRFFCPGLGIDEDPVTGSAHCCLAPLWSERLGKKSLTGYQASKRGGTVGCELAGDRVLLNGHAVTVFSGQVHAVPSGA